MPWLKRSQRAYQPTITLILFLLIAFALGLGALGWGWIEFIWLRQAGVVATGEVMALDSTPKGVKSIRYQFEAIRANGEREKMERGRFVSSSLANTYFVGDPITIVYLPDQPNISNIEGNRFVLIGDIWLATIVFGLVEGLVGILLFWSVKDWRKKRTTL